MQIPKPSCGVFLGYRILHGGDFHVFLGCAEGIMKADLNELVDFAQNAYPSMERIYLFVADNDEPEIVYHLALNEWRSPIFGK